MAALLPMLPWWITVISVPLAFVLGVAVQRRRHAIDEAERAVSVLAGSPVPEYEKLALQWEMQAMHLIKDGFTRESAQVAIKRADKIRADGRRSLGTWWFS